MGGRPETSGRVVGERYSLDVFIGDPGCGTVVASQAFPDEQVDWPEGETFTLQVIFGEPDLWSEPMRGTLALARTGASSTCWFAFSPTAASAFAGRVTV